MGQLAASIAHRSISRSAARDDAHAALRFLAGDSPDLVEATEAIECVVNGTYRAATSSAASRSGEKSAPPQTAVDLNAAIEQVIALVPGELSKHRVSISMRLEDDLSMVHADRVQLQQLMLNLVLNRIEAIVSVGDEVANW